MWKCEKCETLNNGEKCLVCGEPCPNKPSHTINTYYGNQTQQTQQTCQPQPPHQIYDEVPNMSKTHKSIGIGWILGIAVVCLLGVGIYYILSNRYQGASSTKEMDTGLVADVNNSTKTNRDAGINTAVNNESSINTGIGDQTQSPDVDSPEISSTETTVEAADISKWSVSSSSTLGNEGKLNYYPSNIKDGKPSTSWVEGVQGSGIGEWVMLTTSNAQKLKGIKIINGYASSMEFYNKNNRVRSIMLEFSDGSFVKKELGDTSREWQYLDFKEEILTNSIKITILDVYRGNKYDDTCIAEIDLY